MLCYSVSVLFYVILLFSDTNPKITTDYCLFKCLWRSLEEKHQFDAFSEWNLRYCAEIKRYPTFFDFHVTCLCRFSLWTQTYFKKTICDVHLKFRLIMVLSWWQLLFSSYFRLLNFQLHSCFWRALYPMLVYTKTVDSVKRARWLARQINFLWCILSHCFSIY